MIAFDYARVGVLIEGGLVALLYLWALGRGHRTYRALAAVDDPGTRAISLANSARFAGVVVLMIEPFIGIIHRLGERHMDFRTPTFQVALILLVVAWGWLDRHRVVPTVLGVATKGALDAEVPSEAHGP